MFKSYIFRFLKLSGNDKLFLVFMVLAIRDGEVRIVMCRVVKLEVEKPSELEIVFLISARRAASLKKDPLCDSCLCTRSHTKTSNEISLQ